MISKDNGQDGARQRIADKGERQRNKKGERSGGIIGLLYGKNFEVGLGNFGN